MQDNSYLKMENAAVVLSYIVDKLLHGGDSHLREYEVVSLTAFRNCLNAENVQKFDNQIKRLTKVQRWQGGKTTAFFDYKDEMKDKWPREIAFFDNDNNENIVAKICMSVGGKKVTAKIEFYKGFILFIKFTYEMDLLQKQYKRKACSIYQVPSWQLNGDIDITSTCLTVKQ